MNPEEEEVRETPRDKLDFIHNDTEELKKSGLFINIRTIESPADAWMVVDGRKVLNFCTNNYLGLANHLKIKEAATKAIEPRIIARPRITELTVNKPTNTT